MKKISLLAAAAVAIFAISCKKDTVDPSLKLASAEVSVENKAKEEANVVTSNLDWTAKCDVDWVTVSPLSGKSGDTNVTAAISANETTKARTAIVTFTAGTATATWTIKQGGAIASVNELKTFNVLAGKDNSIEIEGEGFQSESDSIYIKWGEKAEGVAQYTMTGTKITMGIYAYSEAAGNTAKAYLYRDGQTLQLTNDIKIEKPTLKDGCFPDAQLAASLRGGNPNEIAEMFSECGLIDVAKAAALIQETGCEQPTIAVMAIGGCGASSFEGLELFENLGKDLKEVTAEEFKNFICWGCGNVTEMDFTNWNAYIQVRGASCGNLKKVVLGPNMKGGDFSGSPIEHFDMHLARFADWVMGLNEHTLKYCDLTRTYTAGGTYGVDFTHWRGSGNVKNINFADNAEIHIDSEIWKHRTSGGGVRDVIKEAWKTQNATVYVHEIDDYSNVRQVASYADDPTAMDGLED